MDPTGIAIEEVRRWVGDLPGIFLLSLTAMFNPSLLAAVTVTMLFPETKRLMLRLISVMVCASSI